MQWNSFHIFTQFRLQKDNVNTLFREGILFATNDHERGGPSRGPGNTGADLSLVQIPEVYLTACLQRLRYEIVVESI